MKLLVQSYRTGELRLADAPAPEVSPGRLLVRTTRSVVSVGTEKAMLDLARRSLLGKAIARPDLARQVVAKVRTEGLAEAWRQTVGRLEEPVPLGYSSSGVVVEAGAGLAGWQAGDRVACSGSGVASHAEFVSVPGNFAARIPASVSDDAAAFTTLGAISLHAIRVADARLGDRVAVIGLGLLGRIAVQILKAAGCRVLGLDISPAAVEAALACGADEAAAGARGEQIEAALRFTDGSGFDAVIVFAASEGPEPIELAAAIAGNRGRVVVPGTVDLHLPRKTFFEKELSLVVSRAWGPGVFDDHYERKGVDYPAAWVPWTAQRNMEAVLELMRAGSLRVEPMITHRFPLAEGVGAYERLLGGKERFVGVLLTYPADTAAPEPTVRRTVTPAGRTGEVRAALIGAGLFARGTLIPAMKGIPGLRLRAVAATRAATAEDTARRLGLDYATTDIARILADPEIDLVFILTRHGAHAALAAQALRAGKHVFVEKPLAVNEEQLNEVAEAYTPARRCLLVGFNRRFAPATRQALARLRDVNGPKTILIRVNAGSVPQDSWVHDPVEGGGRIIGEVCHYIDLAQALSGARPVRVSAVATRAAGTGAVESDNVSVTLTMHDGSIATILYAAGGDKSYPRERIEVFGGGAVAVIENFRRMTWTRSGKSAGSGHALSGVDRGHRAEIEELVGALREGRPLAVAFEDHVLTTRASFAAVASLRSGEPVTL